MSGVLWYTGTVTWQDIYFWLMYLQIQKLRVSVDKTANKELIHEFQQMEKRLREGHHITAQVIPQWKNPLVSCSDFSLPLITLVVIDTVYLWTKSMMSLTQVFWAPECSCADHGIAYNDITYLNEKIWVSLYITIYVVFIFTTGTWSQKKNNMTE